MDWEDEADEEWGSDEVLLEEFEIEDLDEFELGEWSS